jgi:signal peptidase I
MKRVIDIDILKWYNIKRAWLSSSSDNELKMKILGNSMSPTLRVGDYVYVKGGDHQGICIGDIIIYLHWDTNATVHRVVEIKNDRKGVCYKTKGDHNPCEDNYWVSPDEIVGVVVRYQKRFSRRQRNV